jgi:outer membrane murein-binding lipoprotein Lpp
MKKLLLLAASPALFLAATGCEQAQKTQEAYSNLSKLKDAGEKLEANMEAAKDRRAERVKNGDTLALPYKDLEKYLPGEVSGYTAAEPSGQSMKTAGMAFSNAERKFTKDSVEVTVKIIDYNGANQLYQGASAMFSLGLESEDDDSLTKEARLDLDGVKGSETFHKKTGEADLTLAVGDRFLVTISGTKQKDLAQVEAVAKNMNLDALAKL